MQWKLEADGIWRLIDAESNLRGGVVHGINEYHWVACNKQEMDRGRGGETNVEVAKKNALWAAISE